MKQRTAIPEECVLIPVGSRTSLLVRRDNVYEFADDDGRVVCVGFMQAYRTNNSGDLLYPLSRFQTRKAFRRMFIIAVRQARSVLQHEKNVSE